MQGACLFLAILASTPVWIMALQAYLTRLGVCRSSSQAAAMLSCALSALPIGALLWEAHLSGLEGIDLRNHLFYAALVYALLAYSYFHIFNMGETARRVRILIELSQHGGMRAERLKSFYNTKTMLDRRVERLLSLGQVRLDGERVVLASKRLFLAAGMMSNWCRILGLPPLKNCRSKGDEHNP